MKIHARMRYTFFSERFFPVLLVLAVAAAPGLRADAGKGGASKDQKRYVVDCAGRRVALKAEVKRIACLYAFSGHVVTMLGRGDDIVAVVKGLKRDIMLTSICPSIKDAVVPKLNGALNMEELLRVRPDVVFVQAHMGKAGAVGAKLSKFNIPYLVISYRSIKGQQKAIRVIGEAIGAEEKAAAFLSYYNQALSRAEVITKKIPRGKRKRLFHSINEPLKTDGPGMLSADLTARAATINVSVTKHLKMTQSDYYAGIEQVIHWNPEVIMVNEDGVGELILKSPRWSDIKAVREGRVYNMPVGISRWGHPGSLETPLALLWIIKTVYPRYASSINVGKETRIFYENFFKLSLTDEDLGKILKGRGMRLKKGKKKRRKR